MKKTYSFLIVLVLIVTGCSESFLDTSDLTHKNSLNFPGTPTEAQQALTGVYSVENTVGTGWNNILLVSDYMSDDRFGGGGMHDPHPQAMSYFRIDLTNRMSDKWAGYYQGIYRANVLLASINNVKGLPKADRSKVVGEASFLRGLYYFDLARLFSSPEVVDGHQVTVPLLITAFPSDLPRATEDAMYGQIAQDFKTAIDSLPATKIDIAWRTANIGRASKWAAEGMMARMFLFYTGYYNKTEIVLPDGTKMTKDMVVGYVDDLIANSGTKLIPDFRNQWPYSFSAPGVPTTYKYAVDNHLSWVGEANNTESIYEVVFTGFASGYWGEKSNYTNGFFNCGQRDSNPHLVIGHGWGFGQVNPRLYNEWPGGDLRKQGSIYSVDDPAEALTYTKAADSQWQETYYLDKKYIPVNVSYLSLEVATKGTLLVGNWCHALYPGIDNDIQLESVQNMVLLRLADVYLMGAELGSAMAQQYMDAVRTRAGLPSVAPTLDNIKSERHYELALEGIRYFDLLRWYGKDQAGTIIYNNKTGAVIFNKGVQTTIDLDRGASLLSGIPTRVKDTGGFLMIPQDQIDLSKVLKQNPGWTDQSKFGFDY